VTAIAAALAVLTVYYAGDIQSIIGAISSHAVGLIFGNPMSQPDYHEQFVTLFLHPRSRYFACHVILVTGALLALATLIGCIFSAAHRRFDRTIGVLGLLLIGHFIVGGLYMWPLITHGAYSTVFAATIESLFFIVVIAITAWPVLHSAWHRSLAIGAASIVAAVALIVSTNDTRPASARSQPSFAAVGTLVRQFNNVLEELSMHYAVANNAVFYPNDHVLYWQFLLGEVFNNTASGLGGPIDDRYRGNVQRERYPRYRFWTSHRVADVSDHCYTLEPALAPGPRERKWACYSLPFAFGKRYANVYEAAPPAAAAEAWIEPLPADIASSLLANRFAYVKMTPYPEVRGRARATLLEDYPYKGLIGEPLGASSPAHWSIVPLQRDDLERVSSLKTKDFFPHHVPFLASVIGYRATYYLLWLPRKPVG
jgi:uncharacterized membrane protein